MSKLKDYYFINDLFDRATAESYNGQSGYYNVNSNFFSSNWFWPDNAVENYRSALVALFDKEYDFSNDTNFSAHYDMFVFTYVNDDDIYFTFNNSYSWNGNPDSNEYYGCSFLQQSTAYLYKFDGTDITVVQNMGSSSTYIQLPVYKVLVTTGAFVGAYPRHTIQSNYLYTNGDVGNSSGGIHIPNPNPTRKIVINGVNYSQPNETDDILVHHFDTDLDNNNKTYDNKGHIWTHSSSTMADVDTLYKKFGDGSLKIDQGAYIQSEAINELDFGSGNFTVDFWIYIDTNTGRMCPLTWTTDGIAIDISNYYPRMWMIDPSGSSWLVHADSAAGGGQGTIALTPFTWQHIALVRNGSYLTLYVDGQQSVQANIGTATLRFTANTTAILLGTWGDKSSYPFTGRIDELRITNKAVWTSTFTPPTAPYDDSLSTDIKLNGVTPDKIMLNGQCYFYKPYEPTYLYKWDFTKSTDPLVDEITGLTAELRGYGQSYATIDSSGIHITGQKQFFALGNQQIILMGKTIEIDISEFDFQGDDTLNTLVLSYDRSFVARNDFPCYLFYYNPEYGWNMYSWKQESTHYDSWKQRVLINSSLPLNSIDGKTIKCVFNNDGTNDFYLDDILIGSTSNCWANNANTSYDNTYIKIGSADKSNDGTNGNSYNMTVTGVRIYANEE